MKTTLGFFLIVCLFSSVSYSQPAVTTVDICVYGGTSAGVIAAYTARKAGKSVILIEPGRHLGGMSSGGLGQTDIGNKYAITGLARDFYRRVGRHYGKLEQWTFEPRVAETIFTDYIREAQVSVLFSHRIVLAKKQQGAIQEIVLKNPAKPTLNRIIRAKMFIDCSYEGDLMAKAGISYAVGREPNSRYNETYNGVQLLDKHQFPDGIDPYKIPGKPESGLVWGISNKPLQPNGSGDASIQAYNFRLCLTDSLPNRIPVTRPARYDSTRYELLLRQIQKRIPTKLDWELMHIQPMPHHKTDINNCGGFSTDMIGMNYNYPDGDYATRQKIIDEHTDYTKGLLYFIGNDLRVPEHLRHEMQRWGYPKDEYTDNDNFSPQLYIREARRMIGDYVMTQANCQGKETVSDGVGMAAYTMDSHNCQRIVSEQDGVRMVKNEGDVQVGGFPPYPISYRALVPKGTECTNLLVPVCLSASHIAYGSIRMEPVFMVLTQSSALAASLAIDDKKSVQKIDVAGLQKKLKMNPLLDNKPADILVDDQDSLQIMRTGNWKREHNPRGSYGPSWLLDDSKGAEKKSVRFVPEVVSAGTYQVYAYFPMIEEASSQTVITVAVGKQVKELVIKQAAIRVEGQTSGEWVSLGEYDFPSGKTGYVEIFNTGADGIVVADAILLVPKR